MFNKAIYSTPLTGEAADRLFSNIMSAGSIDHTFSATLRALLLNRLTKDESVKLACISMNMTCHDISANTLSNNMQRFTQDISAHQLYSDNSIVIVSTSNKTAGEKMLELVKANAGKGKKYLSNFTLREDLRVFYARKANALLYTDDTNRHTVIFTDELQLKHFHVLQMMIPKYLPSLFDKIPLTSIEVGLLKSTSNKSAVEYERLIQEFAKDLDIRSELIRVKLAGFETAYEKERIESLKVNIASRQAQYESSLNNLRTLHQSIQSDQYTLAGLESAVNDNAGESELTEYFLCNKNLSIISVTGTALEFIVHGYADVYDEEAFLKYVSNHSGYFYSRLHPSISKPQMEKLYRAIFEKRTLKLRMCAAYTADFRTGLRPLSRYIYPAESNTYLPNPHIQNSGCIGSYAGRFQEYMERKDYVGAISQATASARNLNFFDSTVISGLSRDLSGTSIKCIEKPDGALLTPYDAVLELKEEGGEI